MHKRRSLKGIGADAFFGPADQQAAKSVNRQKTKTADGQTERATSETAPSPRLLKTTFYITEEQFMKLERLRLDRRVKGERIDKSTLVREAIDRLTV